jgi:hypothetical protein
VSVSSNLKHFALLAGRDQQTHLAQSRGRAATGASPPFCQDDHREWLDSNLTMPETVGIPHGLLGMLAVNV